MEAEKTSKKQRGKPFKPGVSGNPAGRPRGAFGKRTAVLQALMADKAEAILAVLVEQALTGDVAACKAILERVVPVCREAPIDEHAVTLPELTGDNLPQVVGAVVEAVASGSLTPGQGQALAGMVDAFRKATELSEIEKRLAALESAAGGDK